MRQEGQANKIKKPGRKPDELTMEVDVKYVPLPPAQVDAFNDALNSIVQLVIDDLIVHPEDDEE